MWRAEGGRSVRESTGISADGIDLAGQQGLRERVRIPKGEGGRGFVDVAIILAPT